MNICFLDFWQHPVPFNPHNNFLYHLLRESFDGIKISEAEDADLIIFSCFGLEHTRFNHCKKVFYTGENVRPNTKRCNYSFSFDCDDSTNIRIPLWMMYIDWFNLKTYGNPEYLIPEHYLYNENEFSIKFKDKFCSIVFSALYDKRIRTINTLSDYRPVDVYGKYGSPLSYGEREKLKKISEYKFSICFENSIYPGYFTEKLLHAKISGTIPLYSSDLSFNMDFNPKCCINLEEYNFEEFIQKIIEIDNNQKLYDEIKNEPLFLNKVSLEPIIKKIKQIIKL